MIVLYLFSGYIGVCTILVLVQPDFGSALIIGFIGLIMFLATGVSWKIFKPIFFLGVILLVIGVYWDGNIVSLSIRAFCCVE